MKPIKLFAVLVTSIGISGTLMILSYNTNPMLIKEEPNTAPKAAKAPLPEKTSPDTETIEAATPGSETAMYILKYNTETDTVLLITKKSDGTELISPVESINTTYLTESDIEALTKGIELTSREDMFILIEDYSS